MAAQKLDKSASYRICRYFTPSSLTASQTSSVRERALGSRMAVPLTYRIMLDDHARKVQLENRNEQTAANRVSALRAFLRANCLTEDDVVGDEMRMRYPEALERFVAALQAVGRSARNITNTRSALRPWKEFVIEHDTRVAIDQGDGTPFMQALKSVLDDQSVARVARDAAVPKGMLWGWLRGKTPRASNARYLLRLETYFGLERNSLLNLSGMKVSGHKVAVGGPPTPIPYNEMVGKLTKVAFRYKPAEESPLRGQWMEYLRYKTAAVPLYRRTERGQWRFSPCPLTPETAANWWAFYKGQEVASARIAWMKTSAYFGWLTMPSHQGGIGLAEEAVQTLAWLAVPDYLEAFLDWTRSRIGKRNQSVNQFLAFVASLVRPRFGYLRQRPEFRSTLPSTYQDLDWEVMCERQFELTQQLVSGYRHEIEVSRDSFEPIRHFIELPQPMDAVVDMIQRMRGDRPIGLPRREAVWARDMMLIKILASNPLRRRNLAHLTWRADNTGELYQRLDKSWWIRIQKTKFKNRRGAAGEHNYDCMVQPSCWRDIERYLFICRPTLLRAPTDLVFLTQKRGENGHVPWADLSKRVYELTGKYLPRCAGISAHAFRHLVATSILKADGGDYKTAALVLNDRTQTVEKHYAGLRSNDGAERMGTLLKSQFNRM
ncbi:hypothetical protein BTL_816 [Burkholderia thailandensis H0587]|nr:hypothetical protein BTL_816 [Burkholderia thailandensis H0587]